MRLSVCMIVRDEESYLEDCLASVTGLADEIVVVDTGSRDATMDVARRFPVRLLQFPWCDDFSAARNHALTHATGDWILTLDADERVLPEDAGRIRQLVKRGRAGGYFVRLKCYAGPPESRYVEWGIQCRLFRRGPNIRYHGAIHEQVVESIQAAGGTVEDSDVILEHVGYLRDEASMKTKWERNLRILERHVAAHPYDLYTTYTLGRQWLILERPDRARPILEDIAGRADTPFLLTLACNDLATLAFLYEGDGKDALHWARRSLEAIPAQSFPFYAMARGNLLLGDRAAALAAYQELERREAGGISRDMSSEIHLDPLRIAQSILDLLPPGEEKNLYRHRVLEGRTRDLPASAATWLRQVAASGRTADPSGLLALPTAEREEALLLLRFALEEDALPAAFATLFPALEEASHPFRDGRAPAEALIWLLRGRKVVAARRVLRRLVEVSTATGGAGAVVQVGLALRNEGQEGFALAALEAGRALCPESPTLAGALAMALIRAGRMAEAIPLLEEIRKTSPDNPEILFWLALATGVAGDPVRSGEARKALETLPGGGEYLARLEGLAKGESKR